MEEYLDRHSWTLIRPKHLITPPEDDKFETFGMTSEKLLDKVDEHCRDSHRSNSQIQHSLKQV